jgi:hypothetical protein
MRFVFLRSHSTPNSTGSGVVSCLTYFVRASDRLLRRVPYRPMHIQIGAHITCKSARQPLLTKSLMNELLVE